MSIPEHGDKQVFEGRADHATALVQLLPLAKRSLRIASPGLDRLIHGRPEFLEALRAQVVANRHLHVRILVLDSRKALRECEGLFELARRLSSKFKVHIPANDDCVFDTELAICDEQAYVERSPASALAGIASRIPLDARARARDFDDWWTNSAPSPEFRTAGL